MVWIIAHPSYKASIFRGFKVIFLQLLLQARCGLVRIIRGSELLFEPFLSGQRHYRLKNFRPINERRREFTSKGAHHFLGRGPCTKFISMSAYHTGVKAEKYFPRNGITPPLRSTYDLRYRSIITYVGNNASETSSGAPCVSGSVMAVSSAFLNCPQDMFLTVY